MPAHLAPPRLEYNARNEERYPGMRCQAAEPTEQQYNLYSMVIFMEISFIFFPEKREK